MKKTHKAKRIEAGEYEYRGRHIYRLSERRDAYNPWKVSSHKFGFATLAEAKQYVDGIMDKRSVDQ